MKRFCWLIGHDWHCLFRHRFGDDPDFGRVGSESTGWLCFRCGAERTEQWDAEIPTTTRRSPP